MLIKFILFAIYIDFDFDNVEKYDNKKLKNKHECDQRFLINRLNETCQNRLLLKTFAQSNCIYFCT